MQIKEYVPLILGIGVVGGLIAWVEITLRREGLSHVRARQSIIDRRVMSLRQAVERLEQRVNDLCDKVQMLVVAGMGGAGGGVVAASLERIPVKCLDCGAVDSGHTEDCALRMDGLTESPEDAARRRSQN